MENTDQSKNKIFYLVILLVFTDTMLYCAIVPLIPYYSTGFGLSSLSVGLVFSAYSLGLLAFSVPLGMTAEKYGYRRIFLAGTAGLVITTVLYGFVNSTTLLFICRFLQGSSAAASWTAGLAMVAILYPGQQGQRLGLVMGSTGLGAIVGPPIGGGLHHYVGYQGTFTALAIFCFLLFLVIWKVDFGRLSGGSRKNRSMLEIFRKSPGLVCLALVVILVSGSLSILDVLLPNQLNGRFGLGSLQIGLLFGLMGAVHLVSDTSMGWLSDRLGYPPFIFWGLIVSAVFLPLIAVAPSFVLAALALVLVHITFGAVLTPSQPLLFHVVSGRSSSQNGGAGLAYGTLNICCSIGLLIGPPLGGLLERYLGFLLCLLVIAVLFVVTALFFYLNLSHFKPAFEGKEQSSQ